MKRKWKHINFEQRKQINHLLTHNAKLKEIGDLLGLDPTSISKEIKRNRTMMYPDLKLTNKKCKLLDRYPYVCNGCNKKYSICPFDKYKYDPTKAQRIADELLVTSRRGIDLDLNEYNSLDKTIKNGLKNKQSIYHIVKSNPDKINKSVSTVYRYVDLNYLSTKKIDLPYAVTYKRRKKANKKYDYANNNIDRSNHTYLDYLAYVSANPNSFGWQLDFLGSIKSDTKSILTLVNPTLHFPIIYLMEKPNSNKVVSFFNELEEKLGIEAFKRVFPYILTDRDPAFNDYNGICFSHITGELRTNLFYCDPYVSNQKPSVENMNKQLRKYFPKGKSIDFLTQVDVRKVNLFIIKSKVLSLDCNSPQDAFIKVFGEEIFLNIIK